MTSPGTQAITVRLPDRLLRETQRMATRRRSSVNALIRQLLEQAAEQERVALLRSSYDALAEDAGESDVEPYLAAQSEIARRG